jgi:hypothetical protein
VSSIVRTLTADKTESRGPNWSDGVVAGVSAGSESWGEDCNHLWVELARGWRIAMGRRFDALTLERLVSVLEQV